MNNYLTGTLLLVIVVLFASYSLSNTKTPNATKVTSVITVPEPSHDFGDIDIFGGTVQTTYTLRNEGPEDVTILSAVTSCMCTEGKIGDLTFGMHGSSGVTVVIPAGGEQVLTAIFDPLAHGPDGTGKIKRELTLKTDSTGTPEILVTFSGNVVKGETSP